MSLIVNSNSNTPGRQSDFSVQRFAIDRVNDGTIPVIAVSLMILGALAFVFWDARSRPDFYKKAGYVVGGTILAAGSYILVQKLAFPDFSRDRHFLQQDELEALKLIYKRQHGEAGLTDAEKTRLNELIITIARRPGGVKRLNKLASSSSTDTIRYVDNKGEKSRINKSILFPACKLGVVKFPKTLEEQRAGIQALLTPEGRKRLKKIFKSCAETEGLNSDLYDRLNAPDLLEDILWLESNLPLRERSINPISLAGVNGDDQTRIETVYIALKGYRFRHQDQSFSEREKQDARVARNKGVNASAAELARRLSIETLSYSRYGQTIRELAARFRHASGLALDPNHPELKPEEKISLAEILWLEENLPLDQAQFQDSDFSNPQNETAKAIKYLHGELRRYHRCEDWNPGDLAIFDHGRHRKVEQVRHGWLSSITGVRALFAKIQELFIWTSAYHTQLFLTEGEGAARKPQVGHMGGRGWTTEGIGLSQRLRIRRYALKVPEDKKEGFEREMNRLGHRSHKAGMDQFAVLSCVLPKWGELLPNKFENKVIDPDQSLSGSCTTLPFYLHNTAARNNEIKDKPLIQSHTRPRGLYGMRYAQELEEKGWIARKGDVLADIIDWPVPMTERISYAIRAPIRLLSRLAASGTA